MDNWNFGMSRDRRLKLNWLSSILLVAAISSLSAQPQNYTISTISDFATGATMQGCIVDSAQAGVVLKVDSTNNLALGKAATVVTPNNEIGRAHV